MSIEAWIGADQYLYTRETSHALHFCTVIWFAGYSLQLRSFITLGILLVWNNLQDLPVLASLSKTTERELRLFSLNGEHSPQNVTVYAFVLGLTSGLGLALLQCYKSVLGCYLFCLSLFHMLEYLLTSLTSPYFGLNGKRLASSNPAIILSDLDTQHFF